MIIYFLLNYIFIENFAEGHLPVKQPAFKSLPMNIKSEENETIFLPCVAENLGGSSIRWWKDGSLISDSGSPMMTISPKVAVMKDGIAIDSLEPEDAGEYTCELVRPKPWSSLKQTHKVQVLYPPKIYRNPLEGRIELNLGDKVRMGCAVTGMPTPVVTWKTKGVTLDSIAENKQMLEFTAVSRHMSGIYQCEAFNGIGPPVHANTVLRILYKPEIIVEKSWVHAAPGIKTELICKVIADPEAQVDWLFNGKPLKIAPQRISAQARGEDRILHFKSVAVSDFGNYSCEAKNSLGFGQGFMQLSGVANPIIIKKAEGISPTEFNLVWEADSYSPIFEYKLHFRKHESGPWVSFIIPADSFPSGPLHSKSYTFSGLDKFSLYEAKIFSRNRFGWSNSSEVIKFGFMKPKYSRADASSEEMTVEESHSVAPLGPSILPTAGLLALFASLILFQNTCDIS